MSQFPASSSFRFAAGHAAAQEDSFREAETLPGLYPQSTRKARAGTEENQSPSRVKTIKFQSTPPARSLERPCPSNLAPLYSQFPDRERLPVPAMGYKSLHTGGGLPFSEPVVGPVLWW